jgi:hypothetical protein
LRYQTGLLEIYCKKIFCLIFILKKRFYFVFLYTKLVIFIAGPSELEKIQPINISISKFCAKILDYAKNLFVISKEIKFSL